MNSQVIDSTSKSEKNPTVACLLSFVLPSLGQFYNGEIEKGLIFGAFEVAAVSFLAIGVHNNDIGIIQTGTVSVAGVAFFSIIDAGISAIEINKTLRAKKMSLNPYYNGEAVGLQFSLNF